VVILNDRFINRSGFSEVSMIQTNTRTDEIRKDGGVHLGVAVVTGRPMVLKGDPFCVDWAPNKSHYTPEQTAEVLERQYRGAAESAKKLALPAECFYS